MTFVTNRGNLRSPSHLKNQCITESVAVTNGGGYWAAELTRNIAINQANEKLRSKIEKLVE